MNLKGFEFWRNKLKQGLPRGWGRKESPTKWGEEEIERVLEALSVIPDGLWSDRIKSVWRAKRSEDYPNPASSDLENIVIYDSAFSPEINLARILVHELAHQKYREMSEDDRRDYGMATNWINVGPDERSPIFVRRKDGFVEEDGRSSPDEDFSNNLEYFVFKPEVLRRVTPHAYTWIKNRFGDNLKLGKVVEHGK